jgi:hypothetical protein
VGHPVSLDIALTHKGQTVWEGNITHNLGKMADRAGMYEAIWRPDELGYDAHDVLDDVRDGLHHMLTFREDHESLNPENGWGDYEALARFAFEYALALSKYPTAEIDVSR